ncbi:unnamed protein product [Caenorhabditis nigoni]
MTKPRFPFRRLPDDLCSKVLKTMNPLEIISYSLTSKKALSLVQSLGLSLKNAQIRMNDYPSIHLNFGHITVQFNWDMGEDDEEETSLEDIPVKVNVSVQNIDSTVFRRNIKSTIFNWSNQIKSIGEWIKHICSIFQCEHYEAVFFIGWVRFDNPTLRSNFPKLRKVIMNCDVLEPSDDDIQNAQNVLRAFLPDVKHFRLYRVPLQEYFSIQHIGMANLKELEVYYPRNPKLDDLLILNVERCTILENRFSLRDLNRFFKLWKKGSNRKLKYLLVHGNKGTIPARYVLLKGLQAEEELRETVYKVENCFGVCGRITIVDNVGFPVSVNFAVSN